MRQPASASATPISPSRTSPGGSGGSAAPTPAAAGGGKGGPSAASVLAVPMPPPAAPSLAVPLPLPLPLPLRDGAPAIAGGLGWGLGLSGSGTYTSSFSGGSRSLAVPLPDQDQATHATVREVVCRRKRARAARRAAALLEGDAVGRTVREAEEEAARAEGVAEGARARLAELRRALEGARAARDGRMGEIDAEFDAELTDRVRGVEREYEDRIGQVLAEEVVVEEVRPEDLDEYRDLFAAPGGGNDVESGTSGELGQGGPGQGAGDRGGKVDPSEGTDEEGEGEVAEQQETEVPKKKRRLTSEIKTEDLAKAKSELDELNQAKSQIVWLFKQVIKAEDKRKEELKRKEEGK